MGLNIKAALLLSLAFIGGMAWLIHQVAAPVVELPSPLTASPANPIRSTIDLPERADAFAHKSTIERHVAESRDAAGAVSLSPPAADAVELPPLVLPPLAEAPPSSGGTVSPEPIASALRDEALVPSPRPDAERPVYPAPEVAAQPPGPATPAPPVVPLPESAPTNVASTGGAAANQAIPVAPVVPPPSERSSARTYRVQRGDSVAKIVQREFGTADAATIQAFVNANPKIRKRPDNRIFINEELVMPEIPTLVRSRNESPAAGTVERQQPAPRRENVPASEAIEKPRPRRTEPTDSPRAKPAPPPVAMENPRTPTDVARRDRAEPAASPEPAGKAAAATPPNPGPASAAEAARPSATAAPRVASNPPRETQPARPGPATARRKPEADPRPRSDGDNRSATAGRSTRGARPETARQQPRRENTTPGWRWYTIRENDSLRLLARTHLRDERRWRDIVTLNPDVNLRKLIPGVRIKMPQPDSVASR